MDYFLSSKRLGFRVWTQNDFQLAKNLWGNYEVSKFIDSRGKLNDAQISEKLKKKSKPKKLTAYNTILSFYSAIVNISVAAD